MVWPFFIGMLVWLVLMHFIVDFNLQSTEIAKYKTWKNVMPGVPWYYWMISHCAFHGAGVAFLTNSMVLGVAEFVAHFLIDLLKCAGFINIHHDQALHILCKVGWVFAIVYGVVPDVLY